MENKKNRTLIGNNIYLVNNNGKYDKSYLEGNGRQLSPLVNKITFDEENRSFLMQDSIHIIDNLFADIYYYVDMNGRVIGLGYCDLLDYMFPVEISSVEDLFSFQTYDIFKINLLQQIRQSVQHRLKHHDECAKKMLLFNKKDDASEN